MPSTDPHARSHIILCRGTGTGAGCCSCQCPGVSRSSCWLGMPWSTRPWELTRGCATRAHIAAGCEAPCGAHKAGEERLGYLSAPVTAGCMGGSAWAGQMYLSPQMAKEKPLGYLFAPFTAGCKGGAPGLAECACFRRWWGEAPGLAECACHCSVHEGSAWASWMRLSLRVHEGSAWAG